MKQLIAIATIALLATVVFGQQQPQQKAGLGSWLGQKMGQQKTATQQPTTQERINSCNQMAQATAQFWQTTINQQNAQDKAEIRYKGGYVENAFTHKGACTITVELKDK